MNLICDYIIFMHKNNNLNLNINKNIINETEIKCNKLLYLSMTCNDLTMIGHCIVIVSHFQVILKIYHCNND